MDPITVGGINLFQTVFNNMKNGAMLENKSLIDIASVARVEPLTILDADCMHLEYLPDVSQSLLSMFAGYYLQAVTLLGSVGGVAVAKRLAPLNPNARATISDWRAATESYKYRLPTSHNHLAMSMEKEGFDKSKAMTVTAVEFDEHGKRKESGNKASFDGKSQIDLTESVNLSVGKLFNVTIKEGEVSAVVPIAIRLMVNSMPSSALISMLSFKQTYETNMKERWHDWRAGRISLIGDLILCNDLLAKHRSALLKDKTGVYNQIVSSNNNSKIKALLTGTPSVATASNLLVISTNTLSAVENAMNGKFKNFKTRQAIFDSSNLMIVAVIDKEWERITFYHRGIEGSTTVSVKDIKQSSKGNGPDIGDILKAYTSGSNPVI